MDQFSANELFETGAQFSYCRKYRYVLWRRWKTQDYKKQVMFIGLNPSTADETKDDPTIRRCMHFSKDWGYEGLLMMNVFAYCETDPKLLKAAKDPIGPANDELLKSSLIQVELVVAAWGIHCPTEREQQVCRLIGRTIHCLGRTKDGRPKHPLYLRANTRLEVFWDPKGEGS